MDSISLRTELGITCDGRIIISSPSIPPTDIHVPIIAFDNFNSSFIYIPRFLNEFGGIF